MMFAPGIAFLGQAKYDIQVIDVSIFYLAFA